MCKNKPLRHYLNGLCNNCLKYFIVFQSNQETAAHPEFQ